MDADAALARWALENDAATAAAADALYAPPTAEETALAATRPWAKDVHYFKTVHVSALALLKMTMHARSGGDLEVMGMLTGRPTGGGAFVVLDAFPLPVVGTETRVNAQSEANEYMVDFLETNKRAGRAENIVGWYHSHPGYGCWLSGIDVGTQMIQQQFSDPFLAIVVDPHRTLAAGRVEIGAFRTYPEGARPAAGAAAASAAGRQTIPLAKVEDYGVHAASYYRLDTRVFASSRDARVLSSLWASYWAATLAASPLAATAGLAEGQAADVADKLAACEAGAGLPVTVRAATAPRAVGGTPSSSSTAPAVATADERLTAAADDAGRLATEQAKGLASQAVKRLLFACRAGGCGGETAAAGTRAAAMDV